MAVCHPDAIRGERGAAGFAEGERLIRMRRIGQIDPRRTAAIHRNFIADIGLMTPKQVARALVSYGKKNPELNMSAFVMPQVPGSIPRSHPVDGVAESLIKPAFTPPTQP
jgi:hypothetical protein